MGTPANILSTLEATAAQVLITDLSTLKGDFDAITANPNPMEAQMELAQAMGQLLTMEAQLPALLPLAEGAAIQATSSGISSLLADIIAKVQAQFPAPASKA